MEFKFQRRPDISGSFSPRFRPQMQVSQPEHHTYAESNQSYDNTRAEKLDLIQRFKKKVAAYNASQNPFKRWFFEIMSCLVSALCLGAIITIYTFTKDKPLAKQGNFLTLANILGKVASAALILPTTEALGQLKWNWFNDSQAMWDFEIFDKATRGPWGAAMLLYRTKGRSLAALGALLVLLLLAIDSFLQQVVDLPERATLQRETGELRRTVWYENDLGTVYSEGLPQTLSDKDLTLVLNRFFYGDGTPVAQPTNGTTSEVPVSCPTSSCTWPLYETLAVCSQCADISNYLTYTCNNGTVDWTSDLTGGYRANETYPNATMCGYFFNSAEQPPVLMSGYRLDPATSKPAEALVVRTTPMLSVFDKTPLMGHGSVHFPDIRNPIADVLIVSAADGTAASVYRGDPPIAQECVISWCVKTLRSTHTYGVYREDVEEVHTNTTTGPFPWITKPLSTPAANGTEVDYTENIEISVEIALSDSKASSYGLSSDTAYNIMMVFDDVFPSFYTAKDDSTTPVFRFWTWKDGPAYSWKLLFNPWLAPNNITSHMEKLALAVSNTIRSVGTKNSIVTGKAYSNIVFVDVRWGWLTFPVALLLLSIVFLVATIIKTANGTTTGLWKTSAMPTLIYSLPKETQDRLHTSSTWQSAGSGTKTVRIKLLPRMGWRVSGQSYLSKSSVLPLRRNQPPPGWI